MRNISLLSVVLLLSISTVSFAGKKDDKDLVKENQRQIELLKDALEAAQDSLETEVTHRYTLRQNAVEQRESDKQQIDQLRETQEKLAGDLSRIKEECLASEQNISDERKSAKTVMDQWVYEKNSLGDIFKKDADAILEAFPTDREIRREALERVRSDFAAKQDPARAWDDFVKYSCNDISTGMCVSMTGGEVLPDQGPAIRLSLARFGNVFALGADKSGAAYIIRQTGRLGAEKYSVEKVGSPEYATYISDSFHQWLKNGTPVGSIKTEILQNDQSRLLIAGKKESAWTELYHSLKAGGLIMIPLLLLPLWVLYLTFWKGFQIALRGASYKKCHKKTMLLIGKNDFDGALAFVKKQKGVIARVLEICLERKEHGRHVSERAVREQLMLELPVLGRGINTIAVIAGAAPLMGLLGTISGMITLFAAVTHYGTGDPKFLAGGISEALITAKTGLAIAIPALFIHDFIRNSRDRLLAEIEQLSVSAMTHIWPED